MREFDWLPEHAREHMRDWLNRYAPGMPEKINALGDEELILFFIAYHKIDNE